MIPPALAVGVVALVGIVLVAYVPTMRGGFVWDDDAYVTENPVLHTTEGLGRIWFDVGATPQYYPLVFTTFWLEYHLWGLQPFGYHLVNVLLHATSAVLVWLVLRRLSVPGAWLAAAVFAVHPVQVESVAWITERKNVLSGVLTLAALLAYLRFALAGVSSGEPARSRRAYLLALVLLAGALLSKTVACSLPAVIVLLLWWKKDRLGLADLVPLTPMFAMGLVMGLLTVWMEKHHVGASGEAWTLSAVDRCLVASRALWFYLGKLLWPAALTFSYPQWDIDAGLWWQYLFLIGVIAGGLVLWLLRRRTGKGPLVAFLVFGGVLVPALGFVDVYPMRYSFVADHFQYMACIGPTALAAALLTMGLGRLSAGFEDEPEPTSAPIMGGAWRVLPPGVLVAILGVLTWQQGKAYKDQETLWLDTLAKNPVSWMAHNNLGNLLQDRGEYEPASRHYREVLRVKPKFAQAHYNLANTLRHLGQTDEAAAEYKEALRIRPQYPEALANLGATLDGAGQIDEAVTYYQQALQLMPDASGIHVNLGNAFARQGKLDRAIEHFEAAARLAPDYVAAHRGLGIVLARSGRLAEAAAAFRRVLSLRSADEGTRCLLGDVLLQHGLVDEAIAEYREVLRVNPQHAQAPKALERALQIRGGS